MRIQAHEGHLGLMREQCHCKPGGFKQGCVEGFMIYIKISNGFLSKHPRFRRGHSSHKDVQYSNQFKHIRRQSFISKLLTGCMIYKNSALNYPKTYFKGADKYSHAASEDSGICSNAQNLMYKDYFILYHKYRVLLQVVFNYS